jgi:hypothetical protein
MHGSRPGDSLETTGKIHRHGIVGWRDVAVAMERLTAQLRGPKG